MKIRHKQSGVELEGKLEDVGDDFKEPSSIVLGASFYSKQHWEEVKTWKDVTERIDERAMNDMMKRDDPKTDYRLRKVKCFLGYCSSIARDAFIIEQRQS